MYIRYKEKLLVEIHVGRKGERRAVLTVSSSHEEPMGRPRKEALPNTWGRLYLRWRDRKREREREGKGETVKPGTEFKDGCAHRQRRRNKMVFIYMRKKGADNAKLKKKQYKFETSLSKYGCKIACSTFIFKEVIFYLFCEEIMC